jgi:RimJ/RimL family protein N-acetyltransferase
VILPDARQRYIPQLCLQWYPPDWESPLLDILANRQPEKAYRHLYLLKKIKFDYHQKLLPDHSVEPINQHILHRKLLNHKQVLGWIESFWPSSTDFIEKGFGFCVINHQAITSWCLSVFARNKRFELGVATAEEYRRQGYASLAAAACLEHCLLKDLVPEWHCWEDNLPSVKLDEKIGFKQSLSYPAFRIKTGYKGHRKGELECCTMSISSFAFAPPSALRAF